MSVQNLKELTFRNLMVKLKNKFFFWKRTHHFNAKFCDWV